MVTVGAHVADKTYPVAEARAHGVGYFEFSRDEAERRREQEVLRAVREETLARQREAEAVRRKREAQKQARLIAARQRQRARLGLEPISLEEILKDIKPAAAQEEKEAEEEVTPGPSTAASLEVALKKAAHVRPWDVGKDNAGQPVLSQEEWVEKQRAERKAEFGPMYSDVVPSFDPSRPPPAGAKKKRRLAGSEDAQLSPEEAIEAGLRLIREQVQRERRS